MSKKVIAIPKDKKELEGFLAQIGEEKRAIDNIGLKLKPKIAPLEAEVTVIQAEVAKLQAKMSLLQAKEMVNIEPHEEKILELVEGISAYAKTNRSELTEGLKLKTVKLLNGILEWRKGKEAISITDDDAAVESMETLELEQFINTTKKPDKIAMLKEADLAKTVLGVSIIQKETFSIIPKGFEAIEGYVEELKVEIATQVDKLKKAAA